jgi:hypothetical protein
MNTQTLNELAAAIPENTPTTVPLGRYRIDGLYVDLNYYRNAQPERVYHCLEYCPPISTNFLTVGLCQHITLEDALASFVQRRWYGNRLVPESQMQWITAASQVVCQADTSALPDCYICTDKVTGDFRQPCGKHDGDGICFGCLVKATNNGDRFRCGLCNARFYHDGDEWQADDD